MSNGEPPREHLYHAEAEVLSGLLRLPLAQQVKSQAYAKLPEAGGYLSQHQHDYRLEGVISYASAYTQVAGNPDAKEGHGWSTLATSVVEGLNLLDVVTADRVVAQISVEHPLKGYVPTITFLGTRFENLKIAGHRVELELDLNLLGPKPENDAPYTRGAGFLDRVAKQHDRVRAHPNLLQELISRYTGVSAENKTPEAVECSLVNQAGGGFPGECHGHLIHVPNFGTICLANVRLEQSEYTPAGTPKNTLIHLTMIEARIGCLADGVTQIASGKTNGTTKP
jgi:hypothetical protein